MKKKTKEKPTGASPVKWPDFRRHKYRGWVCCGCGEYCRNTVEMRIHERRAIRGVGCTHKAT